MSDDLVNSAWNEAALNATKAAQVIARPPIADEITGSKAQLGGLIAKLHSDIKSLEVSAERSAAHLQKCFGETEAALCTVRAQIVCLDAIPEVPEALTGAIGALADSVAALLQACRGCS